MGMKFSPKQVDEIVRLLGTVAAAAVGGAAIGVARPAQVSPSEVAYLVTSFVVTFGFALYLRRDI